MFGNNAEYVMNELEKAGYEAYAVGGCVRDIFLGKKPYDVDITTNALPDEIKKVFASQTVIETGIKHGTVTVLVGGEPFEVTTYRIDGEYNDSRHPEKVTFSSDIATDLSRRDFTVNSMAMDLRGNTVDLFGSRNDIENKIIRCTGNASERFSEDALRIMRAIRFSSVLGFEIEEKTSEAIHEKKSLLKNISAERIFTELKKLLCGKDVFRVLTDYSDVICEIIPELSECVGFDHMSKYHIYDVYTHIAKSVEAALPDETVRLIMLLHDVGKPRVCTFDGTYRHFKGHPEESERIARDVLRRFKADNETVRVVTLICSIHDRQIEVNEKAVRRLLTKISYEDFKILCEVRIADAASHKKEMSERGYETVELQKIAEKIVKESQCINLKSLAVNGNDIKALGYTGKNIGYVLENLLSDVVEEIIPNEKNALIRRAKELYAFTDQGKAEEKE